ncbi:hypothetical protein D3C71_19420 [compost metagenome]
MSTKSTEQLLEDNGWTLECESPLEIRHTDGSFATQQAARIVVAELQAEAREASRASGPKGSGGFAELTALADRLQAVVDIAAKQDTEKAWAVAYSMVFSPRGSHRAYELMEELNLEFAAYYDPDTTYEADSRAFVEALRALKERVAPFLLVA